MSLHLIQSEVKQLHARWFKLLIVCDLKDDQDKEMAKQLKIPYLNINLMLSEKLREVSNVKYPLKVPELLQEILARLPSKIIWLGDIEILFDNQLKQNPIRLFEQLSKRYAIIVSWPGEVHDFTLSYATPEHPEYFICHETDGKIIKV